MREYVTIQSVSEGLQSLHRQRSIDKSYQFMNKYQFRASKWDCEKTVQSLQIYSQLLVGQNRWNYIYLNEWMAIGNFKILPPKITEGT